MNNIHLFPSPKILFLVLIPITVIAWVTVALRTPLTILLLGRPTPKLSAIKQANLLRKSTLTRQNGCYIPKNEFLVRKEFFSKQEESTSQENQGDHVDAAKKKSLMNSFVKPDVLRKKVLENVINLGPQMAFGALIRIVYDGYIVCRLPFEVPDSFRPMLQTGLERIGENLDVRYVSALSWYILNVFGLQGLLFLFNGSLDSEIAYREQMLNILEPPPLSSMQSEALYKQEREMWSLTKHEW
eukprot:jgi/Galph1/2964/GphlegSOOS_G1634.1